MCVVGSVVRGTAMGSVLYIMCSVGLCVVFVVFCEVLWGVVLRIVCCSIRWCGLCWIVFWFVELCCVVYHVVAFHSLLC